MNDTLVVATAWYTCKQSAEGVFLLQEPHVHEFARCNIWYVEGRNCDLLIDSGTGLRTLKTALPRRGERPLIAIATHGHFDHVGALHEFSDRRAHASEADDFATMPDTLTLAPIFREMTAPVTALPSIDWTARTYSVAPAPIVKSLIDGQRIDLGDRVFVVMHLPGHSPGSIGLLDPRSGTLFSGDALYDGQLIDDFPHSNVDAYRHTMSVLRALNLNIIHGGHGPSFDDRRKQALIHDYLRGRRVQGCPSASHPRMGT